MLGDRHGTQEHGPVSLERVSTGGRGLVLIRRLAPVVRYERRSGRNRLILDFELGPTCLNPAVLTEPSL